MDKQGDEFDFLAHPHGVEMVGPFIDHYRVTWKGYRVPYLTANKLPGPEERWLLTCDERFMLEVGDDELRRWTWFLAQCMAVAAGYSHFPSDHRLNMFNTQLSGMSFETEPGHEQKESEG